MGLTRVSKILCSFEQVGLLCSVSSEHFSSEGRRPRVDMWTQSFPPSPGVSKSFRTKVNRSARAAQMRGGEHGPLNRSRGQHQPVWTKWTPQWFIDQGRSPKSISHWTVDIEYCNWFVVLNKRNYKVQTTASVHSYKMLPPAATRAGQ